MTDIPHILLVMIPDTIQDSTVAARGIVALPLVISTTVQSVLKRELKKTDTPTNMRLLMASLLRRRELSNIWMRELHSIRLRSKDLSASKTMELKSSEWITRSQHEIQTLLVVFPVDMMNKEFQQQSLGNLSLIDLDWSWNDPWSMIWKCLKIEIFSFFIYLKFEINLIISFFSELLNWWNLIPKWILWLKKRIPIKF